MAEDCETYQYIRAFAWCEAVKKQAALVAHERAQLIRAEQTDTTARQRQQLEAAEHMLEITVSRAEQAIATVNALRNLKGLPPISPAD